MAVKKAKTNGWQERYADDANNLRIVHAFITGMLVQRWPQPFGEDVMLVTKRHIEDAISSLENASSS